MAYFEDLSPYSYLHSWEPECAVNIGWLDEQHAYRHGHMPGEALEALFLRCLCNVQQTRGFHDCPFCDATREGFGLTVERHGKKCTLGSAEIRVSHGGKTYAAPNLIYHYVTEHGYLPPEEFIVALMSNKA